MSESTNYTDIAVIGGGFAGVYATKALTKTLRRAGSDKRVTIISDQNHHVFQPMLPEVAGSALSPRHVVNPIRTLCRHAKVLKAEVTSIDTETKTLTLAIGDFGGSSQLRFDQLLVCSGAQPNLSIIPGAQEHALPMQNVGDAMRIRARVISRFEEALLTNDPEKRKRLLSFVFVGGGYSGIETAGQILDMCLAINRFYKGISFEDCKFTLIHSGDHLMPTAHPDLGEYTRKKLVGRGLDVILKQRVNTVTANRVQLTDGRVIATNTVVCSIGNKPAAIIEQIANETGASTTKGRFNANPDGTVDGCPWLWTAGDCSNFPHPEDGYCPPTAQFATRQGSLVGKNLARKTLGRETKEFTFKGLGELAAIGHRTAIAEILGLRFSGFFAWWIWRTIYLGKLPGIDRKLRVLTEWTMDLFFPRDITLLSPRFSTDVSDTYLSQGDTLFRAGDPAWSFYIIKEGEITLSDAGRTVKAFGKGEHLGELALLGGSKFRYDATATQSTRLARLDRNLFQNVLLSDNEIRESLQASARELERHATTT